MVSGVLSILSDGTITNGLEGSNVSPTSLQPSFSQSSLQLLSLHLSVLTDFALAAVPAAANRNH